MALPESGVMTAAMINVELGRAASAAFNLNGEEERSLAEILSGKISFNDFFGKSSSALVSAYFALRFDNKSDTVDLLKGRSIGCFWTIFDRKDTSKTIDLLAIYKRKSRNTVIEISLTKLGGSGISMKDLPDLSVIYSGNYDNMSFATTKATYNNVNKYTMPITESNFPWATTGASGLIGMFTSTDPKYGIFSDGFGVFKMKGAYKEINKQLAHEKWGYDSRSNFGSVSYPGGEGLPTVKASDQTNPFAPLKLESIDKAYAEAKKTTAAAWFAFPFYSNLEMKGGGYLMRERIGKSLYPTHVNNWFSLYRQTPITINQLGQIRDGLTPPSTPKSITIPIAQNITKEIIKAGKNILFGIGGYGVYKSKNPYEMMMYSGGVRSNTAAIVNWQNGFEKVIGVGNVRTLSGGIYSKPDTFELSLGTQSFGDATNLRNLLNSNKYVVRFEYAGKSYTINKAYFGGTWTSSRNTVTFKPSGSSTYKSRSRSLFNYCRSQGGKTPFLPTLTTVKKV